MVGSPVASTFTTARSLAALCPSIFASRVVPSAKTAWMSFAPSTTWLLVTITPLGSITKPVPAAPPESGPPSSTMATTAGTAPCRISEMSPVWPMRSEGRSTTEVAPVPLAPLSSSTATATMPPATSAPTTAPAIAPTSGARQPLRRRPRPSSGAGGTGDGDAGIATVGASTATVGGSASGAGPTGADAANPPQPYGVGTGSGVPDVGGIGVGSVDPSDTVLPAAVTDP